LRRAGSARLALGQTRDVLIVEGKLEFLSDEIAGDELVQAHASATGFDARAEGGYVYIRVTPLLMQAWREANELAGRTIMRAGKWLD
jgi:hypothetical protein